MTKTGKDKGNKKKKSGKGSEVTACKNKVIPELRRTVLEIDCEGCKEEGILDNPVCRRGIMSAMKINPNVDSVITSHYREIQYIDHSIEVMESIRKILEMADKMGARDPYNELFDKKEAKKKDHGSGVCKSCSIYPDTVFTNINEGLMTDFVRSYSNFKYSLDMIGRFSPTKQECANCHRIISQDIIFLFNHMEDMRAEILLRGFQIVI